MHKRRLFAFLIILLTLGMAGCIAIPDIEHDVQGIGDLDRGVVTVSQHADTVSLPRKALNEPPPQYTVGPNDEMTIFVMGREELGSQVPINTAGAFGRLRATIVPESGNIVLPLIGPIQVTGRTVEQIRQLVESSYAGRIAQSNVDIIMQNCRSQPVHVTGAITTPGTYYLCTDMSTLNDVLSAAGWLRRDAYPAGAVLTRGGDTYQLSYPLNDDDSRDLDILLQSGDSIYVPTIDDGVLPRVHIFGMVRSQGTFPIPADGLTLLEALGQAQGPLNESASIRNIYLMRTVAGQETPVTYRIPLEEMYQGPPIALAADDRIYVAPSKLARWDIWWRNAIPFTISVRTIGN